MTGPAHVASERLVLEISSLGNSISLPRPTIHATGKRTACDHHHRERKDRSDTAHSVNRASKPRRTRTHQSSAPAYLEAPLSRRGVRPHIDMTNYPGTPGQDPESGAEISLSVRACSTYEFTPRKTTSKGTASPHVLWATGQ